MDDGALLPEMTVIEWEPTKVVMRFRFLRRVGETGLVLAVDGNMKTGRDLAYSIETVNSGDHNLPIYCGACGRAAKPLHCSHGQPRYISLEYAEVSKNGI